MKINIILLLKIKYNTKNYQNKAMNFMARPKVKYGIKDIAKECGISPATVSRVFHQHPNVNDAIREKVFLAAEKFNYKRDHDSIKKVIGIILPDFENQLFGIYHNTLIPLLVKEIHELGYGVIMVPITDVLQLKRYFVFGVIAIAFDDNVVNNWENNFNLPLVVINSPGRKLEHAFSVNSNEENSMCIAVEYLAQKGHSKIGLIVDGKIELNSTKKRRYKGYLKAARDMNCVIDESLVQMPEADEWMHALGRIVRSGATAVICCGESGGFRVDYVMNLFGKKIPEEISIITFENKMISQYCSPPHTTLSQDFQGLAGEAVKLVEQAIKDSSKAKDVILDYKLIERESVKRISDF